MKTDVLKLDAKKAGSIDLDDAVFGLDPRADILHRMVRYQLAKRQAGTHKVKTRRETSYSTKKIYRQKGTGGARHGSRNATRTSQRLPATSTVLMCCHPSEQTCTTFCVVTLWSSRRPVSKRWRRGSNE